MALLIQYSLPTEEYVKLVDRAAVMGMSEHQLAKYLMLAAYDLVNNEGVEDCRRKASQKRADHRTKRLRPLV